MVYEQAQSAEQAASWSWLDSCKMAIRSLFLKLLLPLCCLQEPTFHCGHTNPLVSYPLLFLTTANILHSCNLNLVLVP